MAENLQVKGFKAAAIKAGIRGRDRLDLALMVCEKSATAAGVFTTNLVKAAPVLLDMERLASGKARAILVNAGIANACTGAEGLARAKRSAELAAAELGMRPGRGAGLLHRGNRRAARPGLFRAATLAPLVQGSAAGGLWRGVPGDHDHRHRAQDRGAGGGSWAGWRCG